MVHNYKQCSHTSACAMQLGQIPYLHANWSLPSKHLKCDVILRSRAPCDVTVRSHAQLDYIS